MKRTFWALTAALVSLVSCSDDGVKPESQPSPVIPASPAANETTVSESKTAFARILSAAVSDSKDVRDSPSLYQLHTYSTGSVEFGIVVK